MKLFIFIVCAITGSFTVATDYCDKNLCQFYTGNGFEVRPHIACTGVAVNQCSDEAQPIIMDDAAKAAILHEHNTVRNNFFDGDKVAVMLNNPDMDKRNFATPAAMPEMTWDDELAAIAAKNAMQCIFEHDKCRNTETFLYAGQNIARPYGGQYKNGKTGGIKIVKKWFDEIANPQLSQDLFDSYKMSSLRVGHLTQMISDRSNKVGCAGVAMDTNFNYFVCNYAFTNLVGEPVYKKGPVTSGCKSGVSAKYPNLCSANEVVRAQPMGTVRTIVADFDEEDFE